MELSRFSKGALTLMILFALLATGLAAGSQVLQFKALAAGINQVAQSPPDTASAAMDKIGTILASGHSRQWSLYMPVLGAVLLALAVLFWGLLKGSARKLTVPAQPRPGPRPTARQGPPASVKGDPSVDQRLFLHLVSVLQREGRLLDFLFEDLNAYEDSQIGAAVRPIHDSCSRILKKTLAPRPILDTSEGAPVTVEAGFDPAAIKLTGNVTGEPPFRGTLRHAGWRAAKLELPTLSGTPTPQLIAPAEVELE